MQTGSSGTLIGWKSGQTTFVPPWDRMEGAWLWTPQAVSAAIIQNTAAETFPYKQRAKLQNAFFLRERRKSHSFVKALPIFCNFKSEPFACSAKTSLGSFQFITLSEPRLFSL